MDPQLLQDLTATLISKLGAEADAIAISTGHRTIISISSTRHSKILIGPHGEHLRAINAVLRRLVEQTHGEEAANFLVDVNGYHEERMEQVRSGARMLAQRARLFKHDVEMSPMNPYERLVVHELFAEDPEIQTESQGEGKFRHIVLKYKERQNYTV